MAKTWFCQCSIKIQPTADNKRVSGVVPSALRSNPSLSLRTLETRKPLSQQILTTVVDHTTHFHYYFHRSPLA